MVKENGWIGTTMEIIVDCLQMFNGIWISSSSN